MSIPIFKPDEVVDKTFTRRGEKLPTWPIGHSYVNPSLKLLYSPIAKSACSSIKRMMTLESNIEHKEYIAEYKLHWLPVFYQTGLLLGDYEDGEVQSFINNEDFFQFSVIRDPYKRLISGYLDKFIFTKKPFFPNRTAITTSALRKIQDRNRPSYRRGATFREFVEYLSEASDEELDNHWKPQHCYLNGFPKMQTYRIDDLELLENDLTKHLGREIKIGHFNKSNKKISSREKTPSSDLSLIDCNAKQLRCLKYQNYNISQFSSKNLLDRVRSRYIEDYNLWESAKTQIYVT